MKTAKQLRDKFEKDLEELRKKCKHSKKSDWMEQHWAPGHSTGSVVKICEICEEVVESKPGFISFEVIVGENGVSKVEQSIKFAKEEKNKVDKSK